MKIFDLHTAYLIMGMLYFIMPAGVWLALRENRSQTVTEWSVGGALFGMGMLLLGLRHQAPQWLTYEAAVLLMNLGQITRIGALRRELDRPLSPLVRFTWVLSMMGLYEAGRLLQPEGPGFFVVSILTLALYFGWIALLARELALREKLVSALWLSFTYVPIALMMGIHAVRVGLGHSGNTPFTPEWGNIAVALLGNLTAVIGNTSFLGMFVERATRQQLAMTEKQARAAESARLGRQIAQLDRVRGMGMLSASLGHELSQPLTSIHLIVEHAQLDARLGNATIEGMLEHLQSIQRQSRHAADILQRIRNFIHARESWHEPVSLQQVNASVMALLDDWLKSERVRIEVRQAATPVMVQGDAVQIAQVLVNLYRNAIEAIASQAGREIETTIETYGEMAVLAVRDHGPGFSEEALKQNAKGFFSSKDQGLGLGLLISRQIAEQHQGNLQCSNHPQGGAVVRMTLPLMQAQQPQ